MKFKPGRQEKIRGKRKKKYVEEFFKKYPFHSRNEIRFHFVKGNVFIMI